MAAEEYMLGFGHDLARDIDGVPIALQAGHGTTVAVFPAHDAGVEFVNAHCGVDRSPTGIEQAVVLHDGNGGHHGLGGRASGIEDRPSRLQCKGKGCPIGRLLLGAETFRVELSGSNENGQGPIA